MKYLTPEEVLFIHARLIAETGGLHGLRELALLESAVARPKASFEGRDLYADLFTKAAALLESLVNNHPFLDGNKRTGITALALFLRINGYRFKATNEDIVAFTLKVAQKQLNFEEMTVWLKKHYQKEKG
jgi:death-on-curing protein